jgi:hypothetical protein
MRWKRLQNPFDSMPKRDFCCTATNLSTVRIPALGDRRIVAELRVIAAKGEYAGWRPTRATGD